MVVFFKACPRCQGDLSRCRDSYGAYLECVQCGYLRDLEPLRREGLEEQAERLLNKERPKT